MHVLDVGIKFSFCGNSYMIAKSKIDVANLGLFILLHVIVQVERNVWYVKHVFLGTTKVIKH